MLALPPWKKLSHSTCALPCCSPHRIPSVHSLGSAGPDQISFRTISTPQMFSDTLHHDILLYRGPPDLAWALAPYAGTPPTVNPPVQTHYLPCLVSDNSHLATPLWGHLLYPAEVLKSLSGLLSYTAAPLIPLDLFYYDMTLSHLDGHAASLASIYSSSCWERKLKIQKWDWRESAVRKLLAWIGMHSFPSLPITNQVEEALRNMFVGKKYIYIFVGMDVW